MSKASEAFSSCAKCARDGAGAAVLSHAGCIAAPVVAGLFGASVSGSFMMAAMFITSPLIAVGVTYGLDKWRGCKPSVPKLLGSAGIALALAFAIHTTFGHDHGNHSGHDHSHHQISLSVADDPNICRGAGSQVKLANSAI